MTLLQPQAQTDLISTILASLGIVYLVAVAIPLTVIDLREHRLPNRLVVPSLAVTALGQVAADAVSGKWLNTGQALLVAAVAFAVALGANLLGSLGMGDVKLIAAMAFSLGWFNAWATAWALTYGLLVAVVVIAALLVAKRTSLTSKIPFGPYLLAGFVAVLPQTFM